MVPVTRSRVKRFRPPCGPNGVRSDENTTVRPSGPTVGRPRGRQDRDELRKLVAADDPLLGEAPEEQRVAVEILARKRHDAVAGDPDPRLEEMERFELRAALALHHGMRPGAGERLRVDVGVAG